MFDDMTPESLADLLGDIEPARLKGLDLLAQRSPGAGAWFPTDLDGDDLVEATCEMIDYIEVSTAACQRLMRVGPVPLTGALVTDFAL